MASRKRLRSRRHFLVGYRKTHPVCQGQAYLHPWPHGALLIRSCPPREGWRSLTASLRNRLWRASLAFTRVTACTLALSPIRDTHPEGFSYFVTSIAAPVASGWSGCRAGLTPTGKRRLVTAHAKCGPQATVDDSARGEVPMGTPVMFPSPTAS